MSSASEKAEVILIVIKRIIKWILITAMIIAGIILIVIIHGDYRYNRDMDLRLEYEREKQELEGNVVINAMHAAGMGCQKDYPYFYSVKNNTNKTVRMVKFKVDLMRKGFSKPLNEITELEEDKILKPGESYGRCFRVISNEDYVTPVTERFVDITVSGKRIEFSE